MSIAEIPQYLKRMTHNGALGEQKELDMFEKENKYFVAKRSDCEKYLTPEEHKILLMLGDKIAMCRIEKHQPIRSFVVVQDNWTPEYEATWKLIEERVSRLTNDAADTRKSDVE